MNYWQFKFDMKKGEWAEFDTISSGENFSQSIQAYKKMQGCKGDRVFYYRMDKKGIYFIAEIISDPYKEEYNTGYAIDLKIIKRLEKPFNDHGYKIYSDLQTKLDPQGQGASKYFLKDEDQGAELYLHLMENAICSVTKEINIDNDAINNAKEIKQKNINNGTL